MPRSFIAAVPVLALLSACTSADPCLSSVSRGPDPSGRRIAAAEDLRQRVGAPGLVLAVQREGEEPWIGAVGCSNLESGEALGPDDRFYIGSITKTFVASVVLQLADEGRLGLDDPLVDHVPSFTQNGSATIRQLLNQTSGIANYSDEVMLRAVKDPEYRWSTEELLEHASKDKASFSPGADWGYSNTNYILLGAVAEKVSGKPLTTLLHEQVFDPLSLTNTRYGSNEDPGETVDGYNLPCGQYTCEVVNVTEAARNPSWAGAAGAIVSNAGDLLTYGDALFAGQLLPAAQREEMLRIRPVNDLMFNAAGVAGYGLGVIELAAGDRKLLGHSGSMPGFQSMMFYDPETRSTMVALSNVFPNNATWTIAFRDITVPELLAP